MPTERGAPADRAAIEKTLLANEEKVNDAFVKKDIATLKTVIADDGVSVEMSGVTSVGEMYTQLPTMDMRVTAQHMSDFRFVWVNAATVVVSYTWTGKGTVMAQPVSSSMYTKK